MKEVSYMVCGEYDTSSFRVDGLVMTHCDKCDKPLWIAPSGLEIMAAMEDCRPICYNCMKIHVAEQKQEGNPIEFEGVHPEQEREVLKHMSPGVLRALQNRLKRDLDLTKEGDGSTKEEG